MQLVEKAIFFSLALCFTFSSNAEEISVIAPHFTGLVTEDGTGPYQNLVREAARRADISFKEVVAPDKRAIYLFKAKKYDCIYSYTNILRAELGDQNIISSFPLSAFKEYIFTKKGGSTLTSINQLKGISVGSKIGNEIWHDKLVSAGVKIDYSSDDIYSIKMLENGRIQAYLGFLPDNTKYLSKLNYSPEHPLFTDFDKITCHVNPKTKKFIKRISSSLREMKNDGTTSKILGAIYLDFDENEFLNK